MKTTKIGIAICFLSCVHTPFVVGMPQLSKERSTTQVTDHSAFRPVTQADETSGFQRDSSKRPLAVKIYPFYNKLPSTGQCLVAIELNIAKGWHINANPANPDWMKPTVVTLKTKYDIKLSKTKYPKHHKLPVPGSPDPYHVYDGKAIVYGLLEIKDISSVEDVELEFRVDFQGCNSDQCLPPDSIVMKGKLPVASTGEALKKVNAEKFPKPKKKDAEAK